MGGWNKGLTKETDSRVAKISRSNLGPKHYRWGKTLSEEIKEKIRKAKLGKKLSKKHRISLSKAVKRRNWSEEWSEERRERMREMNIGDKNPMWGKPPWNKGLTAKTNKIIRKKAEDQIGKKLTEEIRIKISKAFRGKRNPNWGKKGANHPAWIHGKGYEPYTSEFTRQLKDLIRLRDGYRCRKCGCPEIEQYYKLEVHHIDYNKENCLPSNLITLCHHCNSEVNYNRKKWTRYFQNKLRKKRPEQLCLHK